MDKDLPVAEQRGGTGMGWSVHRTVTPDPKVRGTAPASQQPFPLVFFANQKAAVVAAAFLCREAGA